MMDWELILEAERRGILPADKAELLAEARRRGLVPSQPSIAQPAVAQPPAAIAEPAAPRQPEPAIAPTPATQPTGQIPGAAPGMQAPASVADVMRPMTLRGTVAGVTRGAALPLAGAAAGMAMGGPPGAVAGGAAGVLAPVVADPLIGAFNRIFGTNLPPASQAFQDLLSRVGIQSDLAPGERFVQEATQGVAAGGTIPTQAGRIAQAVSAGTRAAPVVQPIARAVEVSGMGPTGAGGIPGRAGLGARMGAGATAGMIGAAPVSETPADIAIGGVTGLVAPPVATALGEAARGAGKLVKTVFQSPEATAGRQIFRDIGGTVGSAERAIEAIRGGLRVPTTPGFKPTLPEVILAGGGEAPVTLSARADRIVGSSPETAKQVAALMNERIGALQAQLVRINQQIDQQGAVLRPEALENLRQTRDAILRNIEQEGTAAEDALRAVTSRLPRAPQAQGEVIAGRLRQLDELTRREQVNPRYETAKQLGGDVANIEMTPIVSAVESVLGKPIHTFDPRTGPRIARILQRVVPRPTSPAGSVVDPTSPVQPPQVMATLRVTHDIRSALNDELSDAIRAQDFQRERSLMEIKRAIDGAIESAPALPQEAKDAYRGANEYFSTVYAPRFREREAGQALAETTFGRTYIEPPQIVDRFTDDIGAAQQFVRTFAGDPQAYEAMRNGILGRFRLAAVDPQTRMVDAGRAAKFLQDNQEVLDVFENSGMRVRYQLENFQAASRLTGEYLDSLKARIKGLGEKTNTQFIDYILSDPARMQRVLRETDADGKEVIRGIVATDLNRMLTRTPDGEPLTEAGVSKVISSILDSTGNLKGSYKMILGEDLSRQFLDRARGLRSLIAVQKEPMLQRETAVAPALEKLRYTPEQLTDLQVVIDDIRRAKAVASAAAEGKKSPEPSGRDVFEEEGRGAPLRPDKLNLLNRAYTFFRNTYLSLQDRVSPKVAAELSHMIYNNPEAAIKALQDEVRRAQRVARPAGVSRIAPAMSGIQSGGLSSTIQLAEEPEPQP
jgi:hypothetical protein